MSGKETANIVALGLYAAYDKHACPIAGERSRQHIVPHAFFQWPALAGQQIVIDAGGKIGRHVFGIEFLFVASFPHALARSPINGNYVFGSPHDDDIADGDGSRTRYRDDAALQEVIRTARSKKTRSPVH